MGKIAVVTDSNSGISQAEAVGVRVHVLPMPFTMDGEEFFEDINLTQSVFYEKLLNETEISTSQPSPKAVTELWDRLLQTHDEIVHIPMSSGLSAACGTASAMAMDYNGRVQVVDNLRISVTLRQSALDAVAMADGGQTAAQIKEYLENVKLDTSIYIVLDTLKYLKKGGRITAAGAALGTILNVKPVLQLQGGKLDAYAKVRGLKQARTAILEAIRKDMNGRFAAFANPAHMYLKVAYTYNQDAAEDFRQEAEAAFPGYDIDISPLPLSVSCHIGPGALAMTCMRKLD